MTDPENHALVRVEEPSGQGYCIPYVPSSSSGYLYIQLLPADHLGALLPQIPSSLFSLRLCTMEPSNCGTTRWELWLTVTMSTMVSFDLASQPPHDSPRWLTPPRLPVL